VRSERKSWAQANPAVPLRAVADQTCGRSGPGLRNSFDLSLSPRVSAPSGARPVWPHSRGTSSVSSSIRKLRSAHRAEWATLGWSCGAFAWKARARSGSEAEVETVPPANSKRASTRRCRRCPAPRVPFGQVGWRDALLGAASAPYVIADRDDVRRASFHVADRIPRRPGQRATRGPGADNACRRLASSSAGRTSSLAAPSAPAPSRRDAPAGQAKVAHFCSMLRPPLLLDEDHDKKVRDYAANRAWLPRGR